MINGQNNCSSDNKCGRYGYCYMVKDEMLCECKFWWEGELCNQQSNSGKQVIILGCLTGTLVFIFFILKIIRTIHKKRKEPKVNKKKEVLQDPKLINLAIEHVKKSTPVSSCLITILMIIVAIGTLVAKWSIIKEIHNEIINKYKNKNKEAIYFNRKSFCDILDIEQFNVVTFPVACLFIIICIVMTKRSSFMRNKCHGYGAPPIPVDFLSHVDRKFAAIIFAIISDELLGIVQEIGGSSGPKEGVLVTFLLRIFQVLIMGVRFYPILSSVYINSIISLVCGIIYAWLDYSFTIITQGMCYPTYYPTYDDYLENSTDISEKLDYYGTGSALIAIELCSDIPRYLCLAYISVKLPVMLIEKIYNQRKKNLTEENKMLLSLSREENFLLSVSHPDSAEMLYVRNLLRSADQRPSSQTLFARLIPKFIYEWRDDFQFSSRILCLYSSIFFLLFFITVQACVEVVPTLNTVQQALQITVDEIINLINSIIDTFSNNDDNEDKVPLSFPLPNLVKTYLCAVAMTVTLIIIQLIVFLVNIRRNLLQVYRGDDSEIPRRQRAKYISYATGNFHFAGYFIGFFIWGFIIIALFSTIVCASIGAFITYGSVKALEKVLKFIVPSILLITFKLFLNKLLAQYVFLQHYGDVLAVNNRRFYMIFIYFNFFLDAFLGFISAILRFVKSIIGATLYMCRLDYSALGRKLESFDNGFNAYCGFIHTECTHRHPVMLVFLSHLFNQIKKQQYTMTHSDLDDFTLEEKSVIELKKSSKYIRKWRLAVFLIRNPAIVFFRKTFLKQLCIEDLHAINDVDNDNQHDTQRGAAFYTRQMAAQRPSFVTEIDPTQIIILRF
ncbi:unnamed protein product [Rotaria sordida]|uniref:EGF-like domain-containing protein n=1 Tax=Rotaria sordida TaxID=392033 RepID=A0A818UFL5_9BILA|nr:unnamed protein product [Rotaria sordida]CAF3700457.1 unnamed protein product [Rotaria sordida]